jgi:protein SCO1/2
MKWTIAVSVASLIIVGVLAGALTLAVGGDSQSPEIVTANGEGAYRGSEPPGTNRLPDFSLRNYDGRVVRAADLKGKVVLITFLDSQCTETCPILAAQIGQGIDRLSVRERQEVVAVAISTDPAEDTAASVRAFLSKQGAIGKLLFLVGAEDEMRTLWKRFMILSSLESGDDTLHSAPLRIYDRELVWAATLHAGADLSTENLVHDIRVALKQQ